MPPSHRRAQAPGEAGFSPETRSGLASEATLRVLLQNNPQLGVAAPSSSDAALILFPKPNVQPQPPSTPEDASGRCVCGGGNRERKPTLPLAKDSSKGLVLLPRLGWEEGRECEVRTRFPWNP